MTASISIPAPEFELMADVCLRIYGANIPTIVQVRHWDPDQNVWLYRVVQSGQWHTAKELSRRTRGHG